MVKIATNNQLHACSLAHQQVRLKDCGPCIVFTKRNCIEGLTIENKKSHSSFNLIYGIRAPKLGPRVFIFCHKAPNLGPRDPNLDPEDSVVATDTHIMVPEPQPWPPGP